MVNTNYEKLKTRIKPLREKKKGLDILFSQALALEIGLTHGFPLRTSEVKRISSKLEKNLEGGYLRWNDNYPVDYDNTIIARNVLDMLGKEQRVDLDLSLTADNLVYTYKGGLEAKPNNSVDLLINSRVLDYLLRKKEKSSQEETERLGKALRDQKEKLKGDVKDASKYYLSNGFFIYSLAPVAEHLGINVEENVKRMKEKIRNKTDLGLLVLALDSSIVPKEDYNNSDESSLDLFQHPRLERRFSCEYFDEVVRGCAEQKLKQNSRFDKITAEIYDRIGDTLYDYETSARDLSDLLDKKGIKEERLVELGVGTGNLLNKLLGRGYRVHGLDISDEMLDKARSKTRSYGNNANLVNKDVRSLDLQTKAIYTKNFIDVYGDGSVQFWANTEKETKDILKAINNNLESGGYFFLSKKQQKKTNKNFSLSAQTTHKGSIMENTYLYQDKDYTLRRSYQKFSYSGEQFSRIIKGFGWEKEIENNNWVLYKKP